MKRLFVSGFVIFLGLAGVLGILFFIFNVNRKARDINNEGITVESRVSISPDGRTLVFDANYESKADVYSYDFENRQVKKLTFKGENYGPTFSPDGRKVIFLSRRGRSEQIYQMDPDGNSQEQLTQSNLSKGKPSFSPDGKFLVFLRRGKDFQGHPFGAKCGTVGIILFDLFTKKEKEIFSNYTCYYTQHLGFLVWKKLFLKLPMISIKLTSMAIFFSNPKTKVTNRQEIITPWFRQAAVR